MRRFPRDRDSIQVLQFRSGRTFHAPVIFAEPLEQRQMLAAVSWTGGAGDNLWHTPGNWSNNVVPTATDDVTVSDAANQTIHFTSAAGVRSVNSLTCEESINFSGGQLTVETTANATSSISIAGGTVFFNGTALLTSFTLSAGTVAGAGSVTITGFMNWTGGQMSGSGTTVIQAGTTLTISSNTIKIYQRPVRNDGAVVWTVGTSAAVLRGQNGGAFTNNGTVKISAGVSSLEWFGPYWNNGLLIINSLGTVQLPFNIQNAGTIELRDGALTLLAIHSSGIIRLSDDTSLFLRYNCQFVESSCLIIPPSSRIRVYDSLLGSTINADLYSLLGKVEFYHPYNESVTLEVMGRDVGLASIGFLSNFAIGRLDVLALSWVKLIDDSDNAIGTEPEAIYVNTLNVSGRLDLNGKNVYARAADIRGEVIGGSVILIPDGGPASMSIPANGSILIANEIDRWTIVGRAGRSVSVEIDPFIDENLNLPSLRWVEIEILDPSGYVLPDANAYSSTADYTVRLESIPLPVDGNYTVRVKASRYQSAATGCYQLRIFDSTAQVSSLALGQQRSGAIELPYSIDRWEFSASAGQQVRFELIDRSSSQILFTLAGPDGYVAFADSGASSTLINLPVNGRYRLTAHGVLAATGTYAFRIDLTTVTDILVGEPASGTLAGSDSAHLFRVALGAASPLLVRLDDWADTNRNELFIQFGSPPTRTNYDFRYDLAASADQSVLVPNAQPGIWFVLVYGQSVPVPSGFTIEAVASSIVIRSATPDRYGSGATAPLTIAGAGFRSGLQIELVDALDQVVATARDVVVNSFTQASASLPLGGVAQGLYGLRVRLPGGSTDTLPNSFTVLSAGQAHLETHLVMPGDVGRHAVATIYVEYANTGTAAMPAPLLRLQSADPDGSDRPILTLNQSRLSQGFWVSQMPDGFSTTVQILASGSTPGLLQPGEHVRIPVYFAGLLEPWDFDDTQVEMEIRIFDSNNTETIPWSNLKEDLRPFTIRSDAWDAIYGNLISSVGATWGQFVEMLSDNARFLNGLGHDVRDVGQLWSFEVQQAIGFNPVRTLASAIDAAVPTPGDDLSFGRTYGLAIDQRFITSIFGRGWSVPWLTRLTVDADGSVNVFGANGARRRFQPDTRSSNSFFAMPGDSGTLSRVSKGIYEIREQDGSIIRFNDQGKIDYSQDVNGNRVTLGYSDGRLITLASSSGAVIGLFYGNTDVVRSITSVINGSSRTTYFTYDSSDQYLLAVTSPDGQVTTYAYDTEPDSPRRHALTTIVSGGVTRRFTYDNAGRLSNTFTGVNDAFVSFTYGTAGSVFVHDAAGAFREFDYDHRGLLGRVVDALGNVTTAEYGSSDLRLSRIVDPLGQSRAFTWCSCGSMTSITDQLGHTTTFDYAYVGPNNNTIRRMTSFTDANGNTTRYTYDTRGNLLSTIYPNQSVERIGSYDAAGDPLSFINRRGQTLSYTYNAAGQVTRQTFLDNSFIDFGYDLRGNLKTVTEPGSVVTTFDYDAGDRLLRVTYPNTRFVAFTYDQFGRRATMTDQTGFVVNYAYDSTGRLFRLTDGANTLIVEYTYDAAGRLSRKDNGNGTYTDYTYDLAGQLLSIVNQAPGGAINSQFIYTYDELGRRMTQTTIDGTWTYRYDATGQLTGAVFVPVQGSQVPPQDLEYIYDALGNRIRTVENGFTTNYTTNNLNQYTQVGGDTMVYDADGNLISRSGAGGNATYSYDQQGRLVRVVTPEGTWQYEYDAFGNRTASTFNGQRTEYLHDPTGLVDVVGDYTSAGALAARYVHGLGLLMRQDGTNDAQAFYDFDVMGSTANMTDSVGAVVNRYAYSPFGASTFRAETLDNYFNFGGEFGIESGSGDRHFVRARFVSNSIGRFLSIDPARLGGRDSNQYRYADNSPVGYIDINGLWSWEVGGYAGQGLAAYGAYDYAQASGDSSLTGGVGLGVGFAAGVGASTSSPPPCGQTSESFTIAGSYGILGLGLILNPDGTIDVSFSVGPGWGGFAGPTYAAGAPCGDVPVPLPRVVPGPPDPGANGDAGGADASNSSDPNHLLGPSGFGPSNFVRADSTLSYRIEFENYGPGSINDDGSAVSSDRWATAPAQRVVITNTLASTLDLSTFLISGFGFGDFNVSLATPAQSFQQILTMNYNNRAFQVWFEGSIDYGTRQLFFSFQSIDPLTELPPDVLTGFLPPEDGTGRGKGFVDYIIRAAAGLSTGAQIRNIALISFDNQTFIATNQVDPLHPEKGTDPEREALVTLDAGRPTSTVQPLPQRTGTTSFSVSWSGQDDPDGSGVGLYTVFVSIDSGEFTAWLSGTADTQALYTGAFGHTYAFYSIVTDNAGNVQATPESAQATTYLFPDAPQLGTYQINDGGVQRSKVNTLTIVFTSAVTLDAGAITISSYDAAQDLSLIITNPMADGRTYLITFAGNSVIGGSLADGIYNVTVHGSRVRDQYNQTMSGDSNVRFHRLFGDTEGDRDVDQTDLTRMKQSLGSVLGDKAYVWWLDYNADGAISGGDLVQFMQRYGNRLPWFEKPVRV